MNKRLSRRFFVSHPLPVCQPVHAYTSHAFSGD